MGGSRQCLNRFILARQCQFGEPGTQQFLVVTGENQLGKHHDLCTQGARLLDKLDDAREIAFQIPQLRIHLNESQA